MNSLGFIETLGLIAAIEAADTMVKSANVSLKTKTYVGKGLVTVIVEGDVGAVKAAVEAGVDSVKHLGMKVCSFHVIPSPVEELSIFLPSSDSIKAESSEKNLEESLKENLEKKLEMEQPVNLENPEQDLSSDSQIDIRIENKEQLDHLFLEHKPEIMEDLLSKLTNKQLRNISREYDEKSFKVLKLHKANKKELINYIKVFYEK